jgi:hypothetical protein
MCVGASYNAAGRFFPSDKLTICPVIKSLYTNNYLIEIGQIHLSDAPAVDPAAVDD